MFLKLNVGYYRPYLKGFGEKSSVFCKSPCFKADLSLVPFMRRNSCPWYCVVQLPGCGMVPGNTRERDLPSPRCQHHHGFAYGSFKQQWLEAILEQLHVHGHLLKFLLAIRSTRGCEAGGLCHLPEATAAQGPPPPLGGDMWGL